MTSTVVIAGGGPTGMWLACELRIAGVPTVVLEQSSEISPNSRALTLHPRTIETFALRGAHHPVLAEGGQLSSGHFAVLDERLDFGTLDTDFPFTLTIPQAKTTALLERRAARLGADIRRGHRFSGLVEKDDRVTVLAEGPDGGYELEASFLVGCDGTRSAVRQCAGIEFVGTASTALGALGDVQMTNPPDGHVVSKWSLDGTFMCLPQPDGRYYRIVVHSPEDLRTDWPADLTLDELRSRIKRIVGTDYGMHSPIWLSRYSNASRLADHYRKGRVLVAGDAAHQHMPAGGVGLNIGVQDAMNLGWKLAATVNGWAPDSLLDTYHTERHPVGEAVLEQSQAQTSLFMDFTIQGKELRSFLARLIAERPQMKDALTERLSGLYVSYPPPTAAHALTGMRAPNLRFADEHDLFTLFEHGQYVLIDFARVTGFNATNVITPDTTGHLRTFRPHEATPDARPQWATTSVALIRPDGYVAWASDEQDSTDLESQVREVADSIAKSPAMS